jgi:putative phage-type endonuclease
MEQRTDEWFNARLGKVTASRVTDVVARTKTGYAASRDNYMAQLIVERMTQQAEKSFSSSAMQWGTDTEPLARAAYEAERQVMVDEEAFVEHPEIANAGASPDGLVGANGLVEIKCPNTSTHIDTLLTQTVPKKYLDQMMWQMICTGREWCDFVSYDPRMPEHLQLFIKRIPFDAEYANTLNTEVSKFLEEVDATIEKLDNLKGNHE